MGVGGGQNYIGMFSLWNAKYETAGEQTKKNHTRETMRCCFNINSLFCDVTKSIVWYHKIDFMISVNGKDYVISHNQFYDITKSN